MKCSRPFVQGVAEFGCGQCMPCRINRRRLWTSRLMLEARKHERSSFVTLTYSPENLPKGGNLVPRDLQLFLKRLRVFSGLRLRYYAVGEYGEHTFRPHYHLALFGLGCDEEGLRLVEKSWSLGHVHLGTLTSESASYVVGYLCKGMTRDGDPRLEGRVPEFCRMSLRPGIGADAMADFRDALLDFKTGEMQLVEGDVPSAFVAGGRYMPLGRYLRRKLREAMFMPKEEPKAVGELRNYRRFVDLRAAGLSGWKKRQEQWTVEKQKAFKKFELSNSRKGKRL